MPKKKNPFGDVMGTPDFRNRPRIRASFRTQPFDQLTIPRFSPELRAQLTALGILRGYEGYAGIVRDFLARECRRYLAVELDPEERREYENILSAVKAELTAKRQERQARTKREQQHMDAQWQEREDIFSASRAEDQLDKILGEKSDE